MDFFNNASIAAFIGAFSAFLLVAATDRRRRYRYRRLLTCLVADNRDHACKKLESVQMNLALIKEENKVVRSPFMHFSTRSIQDYQFQVLDILDADHKQGLDVLIYWMEAVDSLLEEATQNANELKRCNKRNANVPNGDKSEAEEQYIASLEESETNLKYFIKLSEFFVRGEPQKILKFNHKVSESENA